MVAPSPLPLFAFVSLGVVLGAVFGSYLATVLWRLPLGASANHGRSQCDTCAEPLRWPAIVPIFGLLLSRGRCGNCGARITRRHLMIELACAALGGWAFAVGGPLLAPLLWLLLVLAVFDALYFWLPNHLVAATAIAALLAPPLEPTSWIDRLAGGAVAFAVFWIVAETYRKLRGRTGLGGGDVKLFGAIGLWCGVGQLPIVLLGASTIGILWFLVLRIGKRADRNSRLPLGTFLAAWTIVLAIAMPMTGFPSLDG